MTQTYDRKANPAVTALRMERQFLSRRADEDAYIQLYRDLQPGQNVYWNGFGDPPSITFRANFDDVEFNRARQAGRALIKGRFAGGNLGWIMPEDLELFAALYTRPLTKPAGTQLEILELIQRDGPLNIQQIKAQTGLLVKHITPALHRLQQAFLIYEDQYDGEWDRGWYRFAEVFPDVNLTRYTRGEALKIILQRFAYRQVLFDAEMARSFYKLPVKEIQAAIAALVADYGELEKRLKAFYCLFLVQRERECKPQGFEKQDIRLGGLMQRVAHCRRILSEYLAGRRDRIEELEEHILPFADGQDGAPVCFNDWLHTAQIKPMM